MNKILASGEAQTRELLVAFKEKVEHQLLHRNQPLSSEDERALAAMFDSERGLNLPRHERSLRARKLGVGAPTLRAERIQHA